MVNSKDYMVYLANSLRREFPSLIITQSYNIIRIVPYHRYLDEDIEDKVLKVLNRNMNTSWEVSVYNNTISCRNKNVKIDARNHYLKQLF